MGFSKHQKLLITVFEKPKRIKIIDFFTLSTGFSTKSEHTIKFIHFFVLGKVFIHFFVFMKTLGFFSLINRRITDSTNFRNKTFEIHSKFSTMNYC